MFNENYNFQEAAVSSRGVVQQRLLNFRVWGGGVQFSVTVVRFQYNNEIVKNYIFKILTNEFHLKGSSLEG